MTKQEQIEEMAKIIDELYNVYDTTAGEIAEGLYNAGYRKIPENAVVLTKEEYEDLKVAADNYDPFWFCSFDGCEGARKGCKDDCEMSIFVQERKKTAKEIFQKVVNICRKEEDFQDGTVNTQLEPLYFGIMNGCAFIRGEVKELAKQYGVEVEE